MFEDISHAFFFFEFIALFITMLLSKAWVGVMHRRKRRLAGEAPMDLFLSVWSGRPEDELYAWYRVRALLHDHDATEKEMQFVEDQIRALPSTVLKGNLTVNPIGDLE
jgi:hypothetical protein